MAGNRSAAWVFPVVILAVPGVMFYVWWSHLNAEQRKQMTMKIRKRSPEVFNASPIAPLANPIADAAAAPAPGAAPAVAASTEAAPAQGVAVSAVGAPGLPGQAAPNALPTPPAPTPIQDAPPPGATAVPAAAPGADGAVQPPLPGAPGAGTEGFIVIAKDPTMSPYDLVRIEQRRLEEELRKRELEDAANAAKMRNRPRSPAEKIELQGIVGTPDSGNKAIINGEMLGEGESFQGAKILRITSQGVVFSFNGKKFTKTISNE